MPKALQAQALRARTKPGVSSSFIFSHGLTNNATRSPPVPIALLASGQDRRIWRAIPIRIVARVYAPGPGGHNDKYQSATFSQFAFAPLPRGRACAKGDGSPYRWIREIRVYPPGARQPPGQADAGRRDERRARAFGMWRRSSNRRPHTDGGGRDPGSGRALSRRSGQSPGRGADSSSRANHSRSTA